MMPAAPMPCSPASPYLKENCAPPLHPQLDWADIACVDLLAPAPVRCPITLATPRCPVITPCGHVFDAVAIIRRVRQGCAWLPDLQAAARPDRFRTHWATLWGGLLTGACAAPPCLPPPVFLTLDGLLFLMPSPCPPARSHLAAHGGPELRKAAPCPLCYTTLAARELRSARVHLVTPPAVGAALTMTLLRRPRGSVIPLPVGGGAQVPGSGGGGAARVAAAAPEPSGPSPLLELPGSLAPAPAPWASRSRAAASAALPPAPPAPLGAVAGRRGAAATPSPELLPLNRFAKLSTTADPSPLWAEEASRLAAYAAQVGDRHGRGEGSLSSMPLPCTFLLPPASLSCHATPCPTTVNRCWRREAWRQSLRRPTCSWRSTALRPVPVPGPSAARRWRCRRPWPTHWQRRSCRRSRQQARPRPLQCAAPRTQACARRGALGRLRPASASWKGSSPV